MGSCMSSKSKKGALLSSKSKAPTKQKPNKKKMEEKSKPPKSNTRGEKMSFGFKRPSPTPPIPQTNNNSTPVPELTESIESLVITQTTARSGTPRLPRPNKDANGNCGVRTNRFGFRSSLPISNKVADSHSNNVNMPVDNSNNSPSLRYGTNRSHSSPRSSTNHVDVPNNNEAPRRSVTPQQLSRFTLHTSSLPRPQFPVRLTAPNNNHAVDKNAKTAANNHTARKSRSENGGSSGSSVTDVDSGMGSQKSGGDAEIIEQLNSSPSVRNRHRNSNIQKARPMEMVFPGGCKKTFELRDLSDSIEVTEIMPLQLPPLPNPRICEISPLRLSNHNKIVNTATSEPLSLSDDDPDDGYEDETGEEKFNRDRLFSEKNEKGFHCVSEDNNGEAGEDLWGHEEAMAGEDDLREFHSQSDSDEGSVGKMLLPLRSVLLSVEDPTFATLAAMSTSAMLEDENLPDFECPDLGSSPLESRDFGRSPPSLPCAELTLSPLEVLSEKKNLSGSPGSPGTPTHASNSLSLSSDARDFLIDDEIADQPGLVFDETITANSSGNTLIAQTPLEPDLTPEPLFTKPVGIAGRISLESTPLRHNSIGTLSPCESIASDDMMLDFDRSVLDDDSHDLRSFYRLDGFTSDMAHLTDVEAENEQFVAKEWSSIMAARPELMNGVRATRQLRSRVGSTGSGTDSPRSLDTPRRSGLSSPLRHSRQATSSPGEDLSDDSGVWVNRSFYKHMYQDIINLKAQLLRLQRVLQEAETSGPFENSMKNGLCYTESSADVTTNNVLKESQENDHDSDRKRQVVFLQHQLQEKDKTIQMLQARLCKYEQDEPSVGHDVCNAATQTDRIRPLSTGPSLLSGGVPSDNTGGSLVSNTSESCDRLLPRSNEAKPSAPLHSRVPVGPWRRTVNANMEQTTRKLASTSVQVILQKKTPQTKT